MSKAFKAVYRSHDQQRIMADFFYRRLSVVGLARKYGRTVQQIEEVIRKGMK